MFSILALGHNKSQYKKLLDHTKEELLDSLVSIDKTDVT